MTRHRAYRVKNTTTFETFESNLKVVAKKVFSNNGMPAERVVTFHASVGTYVPWVPKGTRLEIIATGTLIGSHEPKSKNQITLSQHQINAENHRTTHYKTTPQTKNISV